MNLPEALDNDFVGLPFESSIRKGLRDFECHEESIESLLIQIGAPRLRDAGVPIPHEADDIDSDRKLYRLLEKTHGLDNAFAIQQSYPAARQF